MYLRVDTALNVSGINTGLETSFQAYYYENLEKSGKLFSQIIP